MKHYDLQETKQENVIVILNCKQLYTYNSKNVEGNKIFS